MIKSLKRKNSKKGFTLIELIVVIAILAILALILVPSITNYVAEANEAKDLANARSFYSEASLNAATSDDDFKDAAEGCNVEAPGSYTISCTSENGVVITFEVAIDGKTYGLVNGTVIDTSETTE